MSRGNVTANKTESIGHLSPRPNAPGRGSGDMASNVQWQSSPNLASNHWRGTRTIPPPPPAKLIYSGGSLQAPEALPRCCRHLTTYSPVGALEVFRLGTCCFDFFVLCLISIDPHSLSHRISLFLPVAKSLFQDGQGIHRRRRQVKSSDSRAQMHCCYSQLTKIIHSRKTHVQRQLLGHSLRKCLRCN